MPLTINHETCIGCGTCAALCGNVFKINAENKAEVIEGADLDTNENCINESINSCPVQAISREE